MQDFAACVHWLQVHSILAMIFVFLLIVLYAYWPGNRTLHERDGMIPMRDDI